MASECMSPGDFEALSAAEAAELRKLIVRDLMERKEAQLHQTCTALADARALAGMFWKAHGECAQELQAAQARESREVQLQALARHSAGIVFHSLHPRPAVG